MDGITRQIAEANEIKVPQPHRKGNAYYSQITVDGERVYVTAESEEEYYTKARAAKIKLIEIQKSRPKLTLGTAIDNYIKDNKAVLSPSTIKAYKSYRKNRFQKYMDKDIGNIPSSAPQYLSREVINFPAFSLLSVTFKP